MVFCISDMGNLCQDPNYHLPVWDSADKCHAKASPSLLGRDETNHLLRGFAVASTGGCLGSLQALISFGTLQLDRPMTSFQGWSRHATKKGVLAIE